MRQAMAVRGGWMLAVFLAFSSSVAWGQLNLSDLDKSAPAGKPAAPVKVEARLEPAKDGKPAQIVVTAAIAKGWHIYSITQKRGGPVPTKITLDPGAAYKVAGEFTPAKPPEAHIEAAFDDLAVETHEGKTVWTAPLDLSPGTDLSTLSIAGKVSYQACNESSCLPPATTKFTASVGGTAEATEAAPAPKKSAAVAPGASIFKPEGAHVLLRGSIEPKVIAPGGTGRLTLTAEPYEGYHIFPLAASDPLSGSKPTLIVFGDTSFGLAASAPRTSGTLVEKASEVNRAEVARFYESPVSWTVDFSVPGDVAVGDYTVSGSVGFQTCRDDKGCDLPHGAEFSVVVPVAATSVSGDLPLLFSPLKSYKAVADAANAAVAKPIAVSAAGVLDLKQIHADTPRPADQSLLKMMLFGFLGGLILNLMPCVLPVIGLKILSFVEQSGRHRGQIFLLNLWYSAGILAVFMILATLPVAFHYFQGKQFGWGQQFAYDGFNITLTAVVFVMALSFLGVWEIPIPGFVGGSAANDLAAKEGAAGAFFKGALTTVLATPCSGPFLSSALAFAVAEPPHITYTTFAFIGLGMAFPYLAIGTFPRLIRFLPKPGAWMDTFKQIMGFVLLGTVVYLMTVIQWPAVVPTVALLIGLWAGCWWIGRTPTYAEFGAKTQAWLIGGVVAAVVGVVAFQWLGPIMTERFQLAIDKEVEAQIRSAGTNAEAVATRQHAKGEFELPWEMYSLAKLQELTAAGNTVMLDFTADWCQTCQALKKFVLDTDGVRKEVEANGVVPLIVDMTRFPPEEAALLETLSGGQSIPVLAIFPAGRPNQPIVLSNAYTQGMLLEKLREAGPSKNATERTALNKR